jgi:hypothetical protein
MALTGVWCVIGSYLVNHALLATRFRRIADKGLPLILVVLGTYVLAEGFLIPIFQT